MAIHDSSRTVGDYLLQSLYDAGAQHIFGVPGDYILKFYQQMALGPVTHVGTSREDTAAFAADGYARCQGIGALAITYGVGALNVVNAIAGAHAESSPVVVISGAPGVQEQRDDPLLHHRFGPFTFQREIFDRITCATAVLDDPVTAFRQIDRTIAAAQRERKPVYIELPRDQVMVRSHPLPASAADPLPFITCDAATLEEAISETLKLVAEAKSPVLIAGIEVHRRSLQDVLVELVERARIPVAATLTGKSVIEERHPAYIGIYEGAMSSDYTRRVVEEADLLIMLGVTLNDVDTGIYTAQIDPQRLVRASQGEINIRYHRYAKVPLADYMTEFARRVAPLTQVFPDQPAIDSVPDFPRSGHAITTPRLIARLNSALTPEMIVVSDVGDCLFAALELRVCQRSEFLASAFYTTMGFAVPAALGAQVARPDRRALILVGDGAFQMTGSELSTHCHLKLAPIVIVFNNRGYSTERYILDGPFNNIAPWQFHRLGEVFGPLNGYEVETEYSFEEALTSAVAETAIPSLINVHLSPGDPSPAMRRLSEHLSHFMGDS